MFYTWVSVKVKFQMWIFLFKFLTLVHCNYGMYQTGGPTNLTSCPTNMTGGSNNTKREPYTIYTTCFNIRLIKGHRWCHWKTLICNCLFKNLFLNLFGRLLFNVTKIYQGFLNILFSGLHHIVYIALSIEGYRMWYS